MPQTLRPDDPRLTWQGTISLQRTGDWVAPWRLPFEERALFYPEILQERLSMPAGARIALISDTTYVSGTLADPHPEATAIDLCTDGTFVGSIPLAGEDHFSFDGLPPGDKLIELWLPMFGTFRLQSLQIDDGATVLPYMGGRPRWIAYGSSITQCRGAASPTQTWPAIVARNLDLDLTCLGVGGQCHFDQMMARIIRDRPAEVVSLQLGINVQGGASFNQRSFRPAVIGLIKTIRDGHPNIPIVVRSAIFSSPREETPNSAGLTLQQTRHEVKAAVKTLRAHDDPNLHYVNGLRILGPEDAHLLPDDLHPNAEGYKLMGKRYTRILEDILDKELAG